MTLLSKHTKEISILVFGLGNVLRGDDGIGIQAAKMVANKFEDIEVYTEDQNNIDEIILDNLKQSNKDLIIFIDSGSFNSYPGDVKIISNPEKIAKEISTHKYPLPVYFSLFQRMSIDVRLLLIQVSQLSFQSEISDELNYWLENDFVSDFISIINA